MRKMYILCRRDLSPAQQAVQSCHAVAEFMSKFGHLEDVKAWATDDRTMVILGVESEQELGQWEEAAARRGINSATFVEPDIGDKKTAMAVIPPEGSKLFSNLRLM